MDYSGKKLSLLNDLWKKVQESDSNFDANNFIRLYRRIQTRGNVKLQSRMTMRLAHRRKNLHINSNNLSNNLSNDMSNNLSNNMSNNMSNHSENTTTTTTFTTTTTTSTQGKEIETNNNSNSNSNDNSNRFKELGLRDELCRFVYDELKFEFPSPVQNTVIPLFLRNHDVEVVAATGSGKTLAFLLPMYHLLIDYIENENENDDDDGNCSSLHTIFGLILSPTRELANQLMSVAQQISNSIAQTFKHNTFQIVGGIPINQTTDQMQKLPRCPTVLIATLGRLARLIQSTKLVNLKKVEVFVLDEYDRMLEMGFSIQLEAILRNMAKQRRIGLFSATSHFQEDEDCTKKLGLRNPAKIRVSHKTNNTYNDTNNTTNNTNNGIGTDFFVTPPTLKNYYVLLPLTHKLAFLLKLLSALMEEGNLKVLVFCLTCSYAEFLYSVLKFCRKDLNIQVERLHSKMNRKAREKVLENFYSKNSSKTQILFATDLLARGIDLPHVSWTIQFDAPQDHNYYVHRCGRAARAGQAGSSLIFLGPNEFSFVPFLRHKQLELENFAESEQGKILKKVKSNLLNSAVIDFADRHFPPDPHSNINVNPEEELIESAFGSLNTQNLLRAIQRSYFADRANLEPAVEAFVAHVQAYQKHSLSYVFNFKEIDIGELALSLALLRIPRVKEILNRRIPSFTQHPANPKDVRFLNPSREVKRQRRARPSPLPKPIQPKPAPKIQRTRTQKRVAKRDYGRSEWEELQLEETLTKKLRQKKITLEEYDSYLGKEGIGEMDTQSWLHRGRRRNVKRR